MATTQSLRDKQVASIKRILNLNAPTTDPDAEDDSSQPPQTADGPEWKVLVFDASGRDIISTVLRVTDLREAGVTVHLLLTSKRQPVPDTPVIYLMEPTTENLRIVTKDLSNGLYSPAYLNFLGSVPRSTLEDFAENCVAADCTQHLAQLRDEYLNFVCPESDLFHLNIHSAYHKLNSNQTSDADIDSLVDRVVSGLFSVCITMGVIPIIRCPKGGAAADIAAKLDRKLRDYLLSSKTSASTASRPVLVLVDRNIDFTSMLSHSWIYRSLVYDVLQVNRNTISMNVPVDKDRPDQGTKKVQFDLTPSDWFWNQNASLPFPETAENVTTEWSKYQADADSLLKKTGATSLDQVDASHLKGALEMLPELRDRRKIIEEHMAILEQVMEGIKSRRLDEYFQMEEDLLKQSKSQMLDLIKEEKGSEPSDRLRIFLQWYLITDQDVSRAELNNFTEALAAAGADTAAIKPIESARSLSRMARITSTAAPAQPQSQIWSNLSSRVQGVQDRFKEAGLGANFESVLSGVKGFLPKNSDGTLTKTLEALMDPQNASSSACQSVENYLFFDPRSANARGTLPPASQSRNQQSSMARGIEASFGQRRQGFNDALVFVVGGGSMDEYNNLTDWAKRTSASTAQKRRVTYGSTMLVSAKEFLENDLAPLGHEST